MSRKTESSRTPSRASESAPLEVLRDVAETTHALRLSVEEETESLRRSDFVAFARIQGPKLERMQSWHEKVMELQSRRDELAGISAELRAGLEALREDLARAFADNLETVERTGRSVKRLHGRIMTMTRREVEERNRVNYSKTGAAGGNRKKVVSMGIAETA